LLTIGLLSVIMVVQYLMGFIRPHRCGRL